MVADHQVCQHQGGIALNAGPGLLLFGHLSGAKCNRGDLSLCQARPAKIGFRRLPQDKATNRDYRHKFTEKGSITIDAGHGQQNGRDWITLGVTDTGIGMTADQMGKLFQEFAQASSSTARVCPGLFLYGQ